MIKVSVIVLAVLASVQALACPDMDWKCDLREGVRQMDERNAAFDRRMHDMEMELAAKRANELQWEQNLTQQDALYGY